MTYKKPYRKDPVQLRDGFYIEVTDPGGGRGMKIRNDTRKAMEESAVQYAGYDKMVTILGEYKSGVALNDGPIF